MTIYIYLKKVDIYHRCGRRETVYLIWVSNNCNRYVFRKHKIYRRTGVIEALSLSVVHNLQVSNSEFLQFYTF